MVMGSVMVKSPCQFFHPEGPDIVRRLDDHLTIIGRDADPEIVLGHAFLNESEGHGGDFADVSPEVDLPLALILKVQHAREVWLVAKREAPFLSVVEGIPV